MGAAKSSPKKEASLLQEEQNLHRTYNYSNERKPFLHMLWHYLFKQLLGDKKNEAPNTMMQIQDIN
jgi:hypothetical protein